MAYSRASVPELENLLKYGKKKFVRYEDGSCAKHIQTPKTRAGARTIPMIDEVFEAFLHGYEIQKCMGYQSETIDGYTNFVFLTTGGSVITAASVNRVMHLIIDSYAVFSAQRIKLTTN